MPAASVLKVFKVYCVTQVRTSHSNSYTYCVYFLYSNPLRITLTLSEDSARYCTCSPDSSGLSVMFKGNRANVQ